MWCLLIEPYGIETIQHQHNHQLKKKLLIEPYGIETS